MPKIYIYNRTKSGGSAGYVLNIKPGQGSESALATNKTVSVEPASYPFLIRAEAKLMQGSGGVTTPANYLQQAKPDKDIHLVVTSRDAGPNTIAVQIKSVDAGQVPPIN